ncbi:MAG: deaminase, partial [Paraburkholderia caledonica]
MRQIFLLIILFFVGQWLVKALRRHDAHTAQRTGAGGARGASGAAGNGNGAERPAQPPQLAEPMI